MGGGWRKMVAENLEVLSKCTKVTSEMTTLLLRDGLIVHSEKDTLMNSSTSGHDKATTLYVEISRKWGDRDFDKFKEALKEGGNTRALEILNGIEVDNIEERKDMSVKPLTDSALEDLQLQGELDGKMREVLKSKTYGNSKQMVTLEEKVETLNAKNLELRTNVSKQSENSELDERKLKGEMNFLRNNLADADLKLGFLVFAVVGCLVGCSFYYLMAETTELRVQLKELKLSTDESLRKLQGAMKKVETTLASSEWELEELKSFKLKKAMGSWYRIERFHRSNPVTPTAMCGEFLFSLTGTTISVSNRWKDLGINKEHPVHWNLQISSPYHWIRSVGFVFTWLKTDYNSWGVVMRCKNLELSSCNTLLILSRERSLPEETLEMLREFVEERGFPKANGRLFAQTSC